MATSSITHHFVVSDPERFIEAFEESERKLQQLPEQTLPNVHVLKDPKEIREVWAKRKQAK